MHLVHCNSTVRTKSPEALVCHNISMQPLSFNPVKVIGCECIDALADVNASFSQKAYQDGGVPVVKLETCALTQFALLICELKG